MLEMLLSGASTVLGWLPAWLVILLLALVVVGGVLSGGITRVATVLLTVSAASGITGWELREARQAAADRAAAEALAKAVQAARDEERARAQEVERIANEIEQRRKATLDRALYAERAVRELRDEIAALNARPVPEDSRAAALAVEASTARDLLGRCADAYRRVDGRAQALGDQVTGLQDWVRDVCRAGEGEPPE